MRRHTVAFAASLTLAALAGAGPGYAGNSPAFNTKVMEIAASRDWVGRNVAADTGAYWAAPSYGYSAQYRGIAPQQPCNRVGRNFC
jgi:hypothetical protein